MTEKNGNNNPSKTSNDISEMLRLLRESVENDRNSREDNEKKYDSEISALDEEIKLTLEKVFEETSLDKSSSFDDDDDVDFDDDDEDASSWFALEDDSDEEGSEENSEEETSDEETETSEEESVEESAEETAEEPAEEPAEEDPESDDPWYSDEETENSEEEPVEESAEETAEEPAEEPTEEDPESDDPWYSDEETENSEEEPIEESAEETAEEPAEEDPESDDPWYSDEETDEETENSEEEPVEESAEEIAEEPTEEPAEEDPEEESYKIENAEPKLIDNSGWFVVTSSPDEEESASEEDENPRSLEDESIWYNADESEEEDESDNEIYQDEELEDEDNGEEDFGDDFVKEEEAEKLPENDFDEQDLYIYDAEKSDEDNYLYETEEESDEEEAVADDETQIDETDLGLLTTLGVAPDESKIENVDQYDADEEYAGDISYDYDGGEYVLENQRLEISAGYKNERRATLARLLMCGAVALLLLVYEIISALGIDMPGMLNKSDFPLSHIMISLQCLVIGVLISAKQLYIGIVDLINRNATPYSISSAVVLANAIYSIVLAIVLPESFEIFNFIGAFSIVAAITYEYLLLISEEHTFSVFSTKKGQKYAFVTEDTSSDSSSSAISLSAYSTEFNKNYFFRMRKRSKDYKYLTWVAVGAFGASLIVFLVSLILKTGISLAMKNGIMIVNFALPIGAFAAFSYPIFRASVKALGGRGAFVGVSAVDEYCKTRFVTFGEEELFTSLKTTHLDLKPSGNNNVSDVLCKTSVLLSAIGGPMKRMVEAMQSDFVGSEVEIDEIFDDGISAYTNGVKMLAGSAQFLIQHGVTVDENTDFKDVDETNEVLYVSIAGKLAARYYLKYKADTEFIKLVNALGARGISVGIKTRNPGINSDIIARRCPELKYKVYTIKTPAKDESEQNLSKVTTDSGIVAAGKASSLAYPLLACCDLKKYYKFDMILRIASAALGAAMVIANAITAGSAELSIISALLYQCVWMLPSVLFGIFHFKHRSKKKKFKIVYR